jgi:DNA polymerase (family X)
LADPGLDILGHPTGRILLGREGYRIDLDRVLDAAKKYGKVIELNSNPERLDLDWAGCRRAKERGVLVSINPDAHSTLALENLEFGVATARRGWLEAENVLNIRSAEEILRMSRKRHAA